MTGNEQPLDARLAAAGEAWRTRRYTGAALPRSSVAPPIRRWTWALPAAGAAALLVLVAGGLFDRDPVWPDSLRPVVRGSPYDVARPERGDVTLTVAMPTRPVRRSCFADPSACEQPTG
ncbi:MAG: hypothetical protein AAGE01_25785 [Pseudomonadota bacterium]